MRKTQNKSECNEIRDILIDRLRIYLTEIIEILYEVIYVMVSLQYLSDCLLLIFIRNEVILNFYFKVQTFVMFIHVTVVPPIWDGLKVWV